MQLVENKRFISFEGIDFSGKSTQIDLLKKYLESRHQQVYFIREPGGTRISEKIREILLDHRNETMEARTEILLYSAARAQLVSETIIPLLQQGHFVIADRFVDSTTAYQGYGREMDLAIVDNINQAATLGLLPGITFYLELPPELALQRMQESGRSADRLEKAGIDFFVRVFNGYKIIAETNPQRFCIIKAEQSVEVIHHIIKQEVSKRLGL
jgi:dTMP kinase